MCRGILSSQSEYNTNIRLFAHALPPKRALRTGSLASTYDYVFPFGSSLFFNIHLLNTRNPGHQDRTT